MSQGSGTSSEAIQSAKRAAADAQQAYLDAHDDQIRNGSDNDKRRIRLQARKVGSSKYEEELVNAIYSSEAEKQLLLALIQSAQEETERIREDLRQLEEEDDEQS